MEFNYNNDKLTNKINKNVIFIGKNNYFFPKIILLILISFFTIGFIACEKIIVNEIPSELEHENQSKLKQIKLGSSFDDIILNSNIEVELIQNECKSIIIETIIDSNSECKSSNVNTSLISNKTSDNTQALKPKIYIKNKSLVIEEQKPAKDKIQTIPFLDLKNYYNHNKSKNIGHSPNYLIKYKVYIYTPNIRNLTINGCGQIISKTKFANAKNEIKLEGNGNINLDINTENLLLQSRGNGVVLLQGNIQNMEMNIIGDNNINLSNLNLENSNIILGGNTNLDLNVKNKLKIDIYGNSIVNILKYPKLLESDITGNGFIRK
ncbi:MAG: GIN domain-containing protein [Candidatus Kapaibacteriota bacterium]